MVLSAEPVSITPCSGMMATAHTADWWPGQTTVIGINLISAVSHITPSQWHDNQTDIRQAFTLNDQVQK